MLFFKKTPKYAVSDIGLTCDVHSHLLPGVDDGSKDLEHSIEMLKALYALGVRRTVLTPHVSGSIFPNRPDWLRQRFSALQEAAQAEEIGVEMHLAAEYMVDEFFEDFSSEPLLYPDGHHILIEMSYFSRSEDILEQIFRLKNEGLDPILAHPERYVFYQRTSGKAELEKITDMGCELQLNILSLGGHYGEGSVDLLKHLLDHDLYTYVATDLHSVRQLEMMQGFKLSPKQLEKVRSLAENDHLLF